VSERPLGVTVLAILGLLVTIGQFVTALALLGLLPFGDGGERSAGDVLGAAFFLLIGALNLWILRGVWTLRPDARESVVVATVINGALALLAMLTPATFWEALPALAINVAFFVYFRSAGVRRVFGAA